jgi:hypothetical protein
MSVNDSENHSNYCSHRSDKQTTKVLPETTECTHPRIRSAVTPTRVYSKNLLTILRQYNIPSGSFVDYALRCKTCVTVEKYSLLFIFSLAVLPRWPDNPGEVLRGAVGT